MEKLFFNTRDELTVVDSEEIAVVQANGNYSKVLTIYRREIMLTSGISKVEQVLKNLKEKKSKFVRVGRSLIVNHSFLQKIDLMKQVMVLSGQGNEIKVNVSKKTLKIYKDAIAKSIKIRNNETVHIGNRGESTL
ncbi:LytTR family transcriptional regulator DNA-binding domain-containing protein [Segatella hominis]|uniref:LytTR family transcriptional regulator DNA-binding domain-containing protein n=1 Tax=Segatella hominis TaxID=2518605 RepID=UPI001C453FD2|nr:LytTR family transcriptional regulator DNA-binding domain-containing protein [Segatella hominis]WOZ80533.1 LytTR family transcriptional regulator DNA-binding domain-containing protein [Segatella hominis]